MSGEHTSWTEEESEQAAVDSALAENLRMGWLEKAGKNDKGEQLYRMTDAGKAKVESMKRSARSCP